MVSAARKVPPTQTQKRTLDIEIHDKVEGIYVCYKAYIYKSIYYDYRDHL